MLDPEAQALIQLMIERQVPPTHTLPPTEARRIYQERCFSAQSDPPEVGEVLSLSSAGGVPLRLYRPAARGAGSAPVPALVFFHGGGWTVGNLDTHDVLCRQLCLGAGMAVVSVDYRMGPEHRFPAAVDDCIEATHWVRDQAAALGLNAQRLAVGGDSAGGNLAAVVALTLRDAPDAGKHPPLVFQLLIYPGTDMRAVAPSHMRNGQGYVFTADTVRYYRSHYIADPEQWSDWRASPLLAGDHSHLPPALVLTAGYDPFRDEGRQYADALSAAGTACKYVCFERQIHGFVLMGRVLGEAHLAVALCCSALQSALSTD